MNSKKLSSKKAGKHKSHPLLIPNPNPKPWNTLYKEHKPAKDFIMKERPAIKHIMGDKVIFEDDE